MPRIKLKVLSTASVTSGIVPVLFLNQVQLVPFLLLFHGRPFLQVFMRPGPCSSLFSNVKSSEIT